MNGAPPIRVVVADDQPAMVEALETILTAAGIAVVARAVDGRGAVEAVLRHHPDVALVDVRMPGTDGISATATIAAERPQCRVLVVTTFDDDDVLFGALGSGASGFVLKNAGPEALVDAVRRVADGDAVLDRSVAPRVFARFAPSSDVDAEPPSPRGTGSPAADVTEDRERMARLTERELDVLWLVASGLTNHEIAVELGVGEATAKTHVSRALTKLGVRDRVQATIVAHRTGFAARPRALARTADRRPGEG